MTMIAARSSLRSLALASKSTKSIVPASVLFTTTTFIPAMTALAGFVPCADAGMRQTFLCCSPRSSWYARIVSRPVYSP